MRTIGTKGDLRMALIDTAGASLETSDALVHFLEDNQGDILDNCAATYPIGGEKMQEVLDYIWLCVIGPT